MQDMHIAALHGVATRRMKGMPKRQHARLGRSISHTSAAAGAAVWCSIVHHHRISKDGLAGTGLHSSLPPNRPCRMHKQRDLPVIFPIPSKISTRSSSSFLLQDDRRRIHSLTRAHPGAESPPSLSTTLIRGNPWTSITKVTGLFLDGGPLTSYHE